MTLCQPPHPPSHKFFLFEQITISSNFDSGNLLNAQCVSKSSFNLWLCADHPKNQYRTWFYFSIAGVAKGSTVSFNIKNMQNQSRMLNEGLLPVCRESSSDQWNRVNHKVDLAKIMHYDGGIEWTFKHTFASDEDHYFAFFYPWSNSDNEQFLNRIEQKCKQQTGIYFKRSNIVYSLEGRPVIFLTLSSTKGIMNKKEDFADEHLFPNKDEPREFKPDKKGVIIGARVHPGEVPSSHVITGIIQQLTNPTLQAQLLRDNFVFYIFPIFNPDGVARGHYRVDTNGVNLNRCYISPSPTLHPAIYAVRKTILHFHRNNKYFAFLDLHAHAARKGAFIYGNSTNQLQKQVEICLFPKILSMNSKIFEYQASNFTESNMYCKDKNDSVSKEGAGRVALFKITKNPYTWTLECNYNSSKVENVLEKPREQGEDPYKINQNSLNPNLILTHKYPETCQPNEFYTIAHFHKLGKQICDSLLDIIGIHPFSRINNKSNRFKCIENMRMNLAIDLLRMAPSRFDSRYKKIYRFLDGTNENAEQVARALKALYFMLIKKAKIENLNAFIKENDDKSLLYDRSLQKKGTPQSVKPENIRIKQKYSTKTSKTLSSREPATKKEDQIQKSVQNFAESPRDADPQSESSILSRQSTQKIGQQQSRFKRINCFQPQEGINFCNKVKFFRKSVNFTSKRIYLKSSVMKETNQTSTSTKDEKSTNNFVNLSSIKPEIALNVGMNSRLLSK